MRNIEYSPPTADTREKIEEKWGITFDEMDKYDIRLDESDPGVPRIVGTDDGGHEVVVAQEFATVDGKMLPGEEHAQLYKKYFDIWSAKIDRHKMEQRDGSL